MGSARNGRNRGFARETVRYWGNDILYAPVSMERSITSEVDLLLASMSHNNLKGVRVLYSLLEGLKTNYIVRQF